MAPFAATYSRRGSAVAEAYLENNIGVVKLIQGELNEGALNMATAAKMHPEVPAFAYNVNLLNEMADSWHHRYQFIPPKRQQLQEFMEFCCRTFSLSFTIFPWPCWQYEIRVTRPYSAKETMKWPESNFALELYYNRGMWPMRLPMRPCRLQQRRGTTWHDVEDLMFRTAGAVAQGKVQLEIWELETTWRWHTVAVASVWIQRRKKGASEGSLFFFKFFKFFSLNFKFLFISLICFSFFPPFGSGHEINSSILRNSPWEKNNLNCSIDQLSEFLWRLYESIAGGICCQIGAELSFWWHTSCEFPYIPWIAMPWGPGSYIAMSET